MMGAAPLTRGMALAALLLAPQPIPVHAQEDTAGAVDPAATQVSASAGITPDTVTLGEHFNVRIRVSAPPGSVVEFPAFRLIEPVESRDSLRTAQDTEGRWTATYTLAAWTVSDSLIGTFPFRVSSQQGPAQELRVRVRLPVVRSVLPADSSLHLPRPAKAALPITVPAIRPRGWITPTILLVVLAAGIAWLLQRRRGAAVAGPSDPRAAALAALDTIDRERLPERGLHHEYHVRSSRILREYVEAQGGGGRDLTSTELVAVMRSRATPESVVEQLRRLLREADRVKFAGGAGHDDAEATRAHGAALRRWIQEWPPATPASAAGPAEAA